MAGSWPEQEPPGQYERTKYKSITTSAYQNLPSGVLNMARAKSTVNKSDAIRGAYKELPDAKAKEIVAHLKVKGIEVNEGLVYQVKKISKKKKPGRKPGKVAHVKATVVAPVKVAAPSFNGRLGVGASITTVKACADRVGGMAVLKEIVDALA
jgi:hypothetical protein